MQGCPSTLAIAFGEGLNCKNGVQSSMQHGFIFINICTKAIRCCPTKVYDL